MPLLLFPFLMFSKICLVLFLVFLCFLREDSKNPSHKKGGGPPFPLSFWQQTVRFSYAFSFFLCLLVHCVASVASVLLCLFLWTVDYFFLVFGLWIKFLCICCFFFFFLVLFLSLYCLCCFRASCFVSLNCLYLYYFFLVFNNISVHLLLFLFYFAFSFFFCIFFHCIASVASVPAAAPEVEKKSQQRKVHRRFINVHNTHPMMMMRMMMMKIRMIMVMRMMMMIEYALPGE